MNNWSVVIVILIAIAAIVWWKSRSQLSHAEAKALLDSGVRIVDVRSDKEFASGHLPEAVNIPVGELSGRLAELEPKTIPVVVYCASGMRSARAASTLKSAGFEQVIDIGSMSGWPIKP